MSGNNHTSSGSISTHESRVGKDLPHAGHRRGLLGISAEHRGRGGLHAGRQDHGASGDTHYKGTISVRVGPAGMSFKGEIEVQALEAATRTLHLVGKGSDTSGTSGASMDLVARIEPGETERTSNLIGRSQVTMSGKAAAFGGRMMGSVADQVLKQFAANFAAQVQARSAVAEAVAPANELNALALFWAMLRDRFRGLFRRKPA